MNKPFERRMFMGVMAIGVLALLMLAGCKSNRVELATPNTPATQVPVFVSPLVSPLAWPFLSPLIRPTGNLEDETYNPHWSPDERFAVICKNTTHGIPCGSFDVWNMANDEKIDTFLSPFYEWSPNQMHSLVYLVRTSSPGILDQLVIFDPLTRGKIYPAACPDWFYQKFREVCDDFPSAVIGGQITGLPNGGLVTTLVYVQDKDFLYSIGQWLGNATWAGNLRKSFGATYTVTALTESNVTIPFSYTIQISGTKAYVVVGGQMTTDEATHLDFHFVPTQ